MSEVQKPPFVVTDEDVKAILKVRDWAVQLAYSPPNRNSFIGTLAFRLAVDADSLGLKLQEQGAINVRYALAVATKRPKKARRPKKSSKK